MQPRTLPRAILFAMALVHLQELPTAEAQVLYGSLVGTARLRRKLIDTSERGSASDDGCVGSRKSCQMMGGILVP